jgi:hypothetical protein
MIVFTALLKLYSTDEATLNKVNETLEALRNLDSVAGMEIYFDIRHSETEYDVLHLIKFESMEKLNAYMDDPAHIKAMEYMVTVREELATLAYEI